MFSLFIHNLTYTKKRARKKMSAIATESSAVEGMVMEAVVGLKRAFVPSKSRKVKNQEKLERKHARAPVKRLKGTRAIDWLFIQEFFDRYEAMVLTEDAKTLWEAQTKSPTSRTVKHRLGTKTRNSRMNSLMSGQVRTTMATEAEKKESNKKISKTNKSRNLGQRHYMEAAAIHAFFKGTDIVYKTLMDGLSGDIAVQRNDGKWASVQIKSATLTDDQVSYHIDKKDGSTGKLFVFINNLMNITDHFSLIVVRTGARYENMILVAIGLEAPEHHFEPQFFDEIFPCVIEELFVLESPLEMAGKSLHPVPVNESHIDAHSEYRYVEGYHNIDKKDELMTKLDKLVNAPKSGFSLYELNFKMGPGTPNQKVAPEHAKEVTINSFYRVSIN